MSVKKIKAIAFDFDGTIADSFPIFVKAVDYTLNRQPFTPKEVEDLRQHSALEVIKILNIKKWQAPWLVIKGSREIDRHQKDITIFAGIAEVLEQLSQQNYRLYIVSSHSQKGIELFLNRYNLTGYFDQIYAKVWLIDKSKALKKLLRESDLSPDECVFVGDEVRDIEAAKKVGTHSIAVTWGFNAPASLKSHSPDHLVVSPNEIIEAVKRLS